MKAFFLFLAVLIATTTPADAGPVAGAIAAISQWTVAGIAVGQMIIGFVVNLGLSALARALADTKTTNGGIRGESATAGEATCQSIIIGKYATAGNNVAPPYTSGSSGDTKNAFLTYVRDLADAPIASLDGVWIDDEYVPLLAPDPGSLYPDHLRAGGRYLGRAWFKFFDGTQTTAYQGLLDHNAGPRPWASDMIGRGIPYVVCRFKLDQELFPGLPEVLFEVTGVGLYDPRKDDTVGGAGAHRWGQPATYEPSENPAVQVYNILRGIALEDGSTWGGDVPAEDLPLNNWFAAMNEADVEIDGQPQYRSGYEIRLGPEEFSGDLPADVIDEINRGASGQISEFGGVYKLRLGGPGLPVKSFTDDDVIISEDQRFTPYPGIESSYNGIQAQYPEPQERWVSKEAPPRYNPTYEAEDHGRRLIASLMLSTVIYSDQVQRVMRSYIEEERRFRRHDLSLPPDYANLEPLDAVAWSSEINGYSAKVFEITAHAHNLRTIVDRFGMRERDPADYDWQPGFKLPTTIATVTTEPPAARTVLNFAVAPHVVVDASGDARRPAIRMTWDGDQPDARGLRYQVRPFSQTDVASQGSTQDVEVGALVVSAGLAANADYEVRARLTIPGLATSWSPWLQVTTPDVRSTLADMAQEVLDHMSETAELAGVTPVETLPAAGDKPNQIVMKVPEGILYRWDADAEEWTRDLYTGIEDGQITTAKFAQGIEPVTVIPDGDPLPTTKSTESVFHDGKLYRWNGTGYVATVPVQDIDGAIPPSKLATIPGVNLFPDADGVDPDAWETQNGWQHTPNVLGGQWRWIHDAGQTGWRAHTSIPFFVEGGRRYRAAMWSSLINGTTGSVRLSIRWYDNSDTNISEDSSGFQSPSANVTAEGVAPSNARMARLRVIVDAEATDGDVATNQFRVNLITGADLIEDAAISAQKIADGAVEAIKLANDSVTRDKIVADAISAVELADNAVTAAKIVTDAITEIKIADDAITRNKILAGAVDTLKLADDAVTSAKIVIDAITETKISNGAISTPKLAAGSVEAGKIAAGAVVAGKIAADAVTAGNIVAGAITTDKLDANAVTASKIAADTITANEIAANAITALELAADSITAGKIVAGAIQTGHVAANAIDASKIAANTITANEIAAFAIGANQIAAESIVASKLAVTNTVNLYPDYDLIDSDFYIFGSTDASLVPISNTDTGLNAINIQPSSVAEQVFSGYINVDSNTDYLVRGSRYTNQSDTSVRLFVQLAEVDGSGNTNVTSAVELGGSPSTSLTTFPVTANITTNGSQRRLRFRAFRTAGGTGYGRYAGFSVFKRNDGELIVDGAITATKIDAGAVNASHISAGSIETAALAAGAVTAAKIQANTITASQIAANAISANELAANSVSATHIQTDAITAGKVQAGAIGADEIATNAIVASKLAVTDFQSLLPDTDLASGAPDSANSVWSQHGDYATYGGYGSQSGYTYLSGNENASHTVRVTAVPGSGTHTGVEIKQAHAATVEGGKEYFASAEFNTTSSSRCQIVVLFYDIDGTFISNSQTIQNITGGQGWVTVGTTSMTAPAGAVTAVLRARQLADASNNGHVFIARPRILKKNAGELIVDGTITANHLAADSVTANAVAAGAIVTSALAAGAVTANKIAANTITSGQINVSQLVGSNAFLDNLVVDTAQLANAAITTAKIGDAAIKTAKIGNLEVTRLKVADYAVTTFENVVTTGSVSFVANDWTQVASLVVNRTRGDPLPMFVRLDGGNSDMLVRIKRDGVVLSGIFPNLSNDWVSGITMTYIDRSNLTGSFTYTVEVWSGSSGSVSNRFLGVFNAHK